jgi:hypothetical protein
MYLKYETRDWAHSTHGVCRIYWCTVSLSCSGYVQIQSNAAKAVNEVAWDEIKKAGEEERKLAIQYGDIDIDGVPMITVVADGQWSKRSYKTKYDALSGVVNIIIIYFLIII